MNFEFSSQGSTDGRRESADRPHLWKRLTFTGGAIFNIVGPTNIHVGRKIRANNVEGGSSRATPSRRIGTFRSALGNGSRSPEVPFSILLDPRTFTSAGRYGPTMLKVAPRGQCLSENRDIQKRPRKRLAPTGGAIFNIVGPTNIHVGRKIRANNVEGGSSRAMPFGESGHSESPSETSRVHRRCHFQYCWTHEHSRRQVASSRQC